MPSADRNKKGRGKGKGSNNQNAASTSTTSTLRSATSPPPGLRVLTRGKTTTKTTDLAVNNLRATTATLTEGSANKPQHRARVGQSSGGITAPTTTTTTASTTTPTTSTTTSATQGLSSSHQTSSRMLTMYNNNTVREEDVAASLRKTSEGITTSTANTNANTSNTNTSPSSSSPSAPHEVEVAANYIATLMIPHIGETAGSALKNALLPALTKRFSAHWHPSQPSQGSGYRCIRSEAGKPDPTLLACLVTSLGGPGRAGTEASAASGKIPPFQLWTDPGEVAIRLGERGHVTLIYSSRAGAGAAELTSTATTTTMTTTPPHRRRRASSAATITSPANRVRSSSPSLSATANTFTPSSESEDDGNSSSNNESPPASPQMVGRSFAMPEPQQQQTQHQRIPNPYGVAPRVPGLAAFLQKNDLDWHRSSNKDYITPQFNENVRKQLTEFNMGVGYEYNGQHGQHGFPSPFQQQVAF